MTLQVNHKNTSEIIKINHLAIIMDGNRRWAKKNRLKINLGHKAGIDNSINLLKAINKDNSIKIKYITLYVFAESNWKRSALEIKSLFNFIEQTYNKFQELSNEENFKIKHFGSKKKLPKSINDIIEDVQKKTNRNKGIQINLAFNYSGRLEIINAVKNLIINKKDINKFESYLYSHGIPDPDFIIRTGGEYRISDFLLWQSAYSEFYFTKTLWPDFKINNLKMSFRNYIKRKRNYGR